METVKKQKPGGKINPGYKDMKSGSTSIDRVLIDFASARKEKSIKDLKGKISFREGYDYKSLRD